MSSPSSTSTSAATNFWTEDEDFVLRQAVSEQQDDETIDWHKVAAELPARNNKDCRKRWVYSLLPTLNKGVWTEVENELLQEGVRQHGTRWSSIARVVQTRNPDQCSRRWHEVMKPDIDRSSRWSLYEDDMLRKAVIVHGRQWIEIVERYFPHRTPNAARSRHSQLSRLDSNRAVDMELVQSTANRDQSASQILMNEPTFDSDFVHAGSVMLQVPAGLHDEA